VQEVAVRKASHQRHTDVDGATAQDVDEAIATLYASHYTNLVRTGGLLLSNFGEGEELAQEAFARLYTAWGRIEQPEHAVPYLRATVVNLARSRLRRRAVVRRHRVEAEGPTPGPEQATLDADDRRAMLATLRRLPARQREAVILRYYGELHQAEVAQAMGISPGAVKSHLHRGLAALAQELGVQR
jgi:RNA polymerase sigma-70 factor (sigma-E family)